MIYIPFFSVSLFLPKYRPSIPKIRLSSSVVFGLSVFIDVVLRFSNENDIVPSSFLVMSLTALFMYFVPSILLLYSVAAGVDVFVRQLLSL